MRQSHIGAGDRVMVTGHSQGGIAAMALACDPEAQSRYNITNVVTAGSPVSRFHPPANVHVLSIEHAQDPVPRLDTQGNPDQANWTTVTRDVGDSPGVQGNPFEAHNSDLYTQTGGMIDDDPALADARGELRPFMGDGTQQDYLVQRTH